MRNKMVLGSLVVVLLGTLCYTTLLLTAPTNTGHASASSATQVAPTLTSQQLAVIQAINTLLLADDEPTETLVLLYVNGDNNLASSIHKLVQNVHIGATNPNVIVEMVLDWPNTNPAEPTQPLPPNSWRYVVDRRGGIDCNFQTNYTCGGRYILGQNVHEFPEDLGNPANLTKFVSEAILAHPDVKQVVLALVGHGGGWSPNLRAGQPKGHDGQPGNGDQDMGGLLWDDYTGNGPGSSLSTLELQKALQGAVQNGKRKIDLLYLDACLMGMWEVAHEVRQEVNYLLASESWDWTSFAYDANLAGVTSTQDAAQIGEAWLRNEAAVLRADGYPFTFSLIDTAPLTTTAAAIDTLGQVLSTTVTAVDGKVKVHDAFVASECFDSNADHKINRNQPSAGPIDNYCDLASFAEQLQQQFQGNATLVNAAQAVQSAVASVVPSGRSAHGCGVPGSYSNTPWCWQKLGGLSIYTPLGEDENKRGLYKQLQASATHWDEFLAQYWDNEPEPTIQGCLTECSLPAGALTITYTVYLPVVQR